MTDRNRVLDMLQAGTISGEEATQILQLLGDAGEPDGVSQVKKPQSARWVRVRVYENTETAAHLSINIPTGLLDVSQRMGARFVPWLGDEDYGKLIRDLNFGRHGQTFSFVDDNSQERVELTIE